MRGGMKSKGFLEERQSKIGSAMKLRSWKKIKSKKFKLRRKKRGIRI